MFSEGRDRLWAGLQSFAARNGLSASPSRMKKINKYPAIVLGESAFSIERYTNHQDVSEAVDVYVLEKFDGDWDAAEDAVGTTAKALEDSLKDGIAFPEKMVLGHDTVDGTWCAVVKITFNCLYARK